MRTNLKVERTLHPEAPPRQRLAGIGLLGMVVGPTILAAGSLSARSILHRADLDILALPGALCLASWGLQWAALVINFGTVDAGPRDALHVLLYTTFVATPLLGGLQILLNHRTAQEHSLHLVLSYSAQGGGGVSLVVGI